MTADFDGESFKSYPTCFLCCGVITENTITLPNCGHTYHEHCVEEMANCTNLCTRCKKPFSLDDLGDVIELSKKKESLLVEKFKYQILFRVMIP